MANLLHEVLIMHHVNSNNNSITATERDTTKHGLHQSLHNSTKDFDPQYEYAYQYVTAIRHTAASIKYYESVSCVNYPPHTCILTSIFIQFKAVSINYYYSMYFVLIIWHVYQIFFPLHCVSQSTVRLALPYFS